MESIRRHAIVQKGGEISLTGLPFNEGQSVEIIVLAETAPDKPLLTARALLDSGLVGMWKDRTDMGDSADFARQLREKFQRPRYEE